MRIATALFPFASKIVTALTSSLIAEIESTPLGTKIVIQAGHYFLSNKGTKACDVFQLSSEKSAWQSMEAFSLATWEATCRATQALQNQRNIRLMTLVNDWQYVRSQDPARRSAERTCNAWRKNYYTSTPELPSALHEYLGFCGLNDTHLFKCADKQWLFSEQSLRHDFNRTLRKILADPKQAYELGLRTALTENNEPVIYGSTFDEQEQCLSYCGNSNCCGEFLQLLHHLQEHGVQKFINLYPAECRPPVTSGAKLGKRLFGLSDLAITNIAITPFSETFQTFTDHA